MRIGFFTDSYAPSPNGIATSVAAFRQQLEGLGHTVFVVAPKLPHDARLDPFLITCPSLPSLWFEDYRDSFPVNPQLYRHLVELKLDVVHTHTPFQIGLLGTYLAKQNGLPLVTTSHADYEAYAGQYRRFLAPLLMLNTLVPIAGRQPGQLVHVPAMLIPDTSLRRWNRRLVRQTIRSFANHADAIICPSPKIVRSLTSLGVNSPLRVIATGVDGNSIPPYPPFLRQQEKLDGKKVILYAGRIKTEKNLELLVESFAKVTTKHPDAVLVLIGPGGYAQELSRLASQLGISGPRIRLLNAMPRSQLIAAMRESDMFAFPSVTESQGLVLDEAVMAGLPVVVVDPEISSAVRAGQNALFACNDVADFSRQLEVLISNDSLRHQLAAASRRIAATFNATHSALQLVDCYKEVLAARAG